MEIKVFLGDIQAPVYRTRDDDRTDLRNVPTELVERYDEALDKFEEAAAALERAYRAAPTVSDE